MKWNNKGHEFDKIGHLLDGKNFIYIYGARKIGMDLCQTLIPLIHLLKWKIVFVDADTEKQKSGYLGFDVISPALLEQVDKADSFVVICAAEKNRPVMLEIAEKAGFVEMQNLFDYDYFSYTYLSVYFLYSLDMVYISSLNIVPSTVCNLNCKGCLNFNPYIKNHVSYELDSLIEDVDTLFKAIDLIGRFQISGGEPLLYPQIIDLIEYIGNHYREKIISFEIVTNGTIIPNDCICNVLKEHHVRVYLDDYRKSVPKANEHFQQILDKLKSFSVYVTHNDVESWFDLTPDLDHEGSLDEHELIKHFTDCGCPWSTLHNGGISACNYALYSHKAGLVDYYEDEYFSLKNYSSKAEIVEFRCRYNNKGYVELCKKCAGFKNNNNLIEPAVQVPRGGFNNEMDK